MTLRETIALKPCPFCGPQPELVDLCRHRSTPHLRGDPIYSGLEARCARCGATGPMRDTEAEAIAAWNARAILSLPEIAKITEALEPFARFIDQFDRKPLRQIDDEFYTIHIGTEFEASVRLSDLRRAREALSLLKEREG